MNNWITRLTYGTLPGRALVKLLFSCRADRLVTRFLCTPASRLLIPLYNRHSRNNWDPFDPRDYATFREYFARDRGCTIIDCAPEHLISPCDGWLKACPIEVGGSFSIKGTRYRLQDLVDDGLLAAKYEGGTCLILRLGPSDYRHYCCIDDGYLWQNHALPGTLRVARPLVPGPHPVYMRHRRSWCLMVTEHFGPVIQTEIGALALGMIANNQENTRVRRGDEKGHFDLAGSAIALLFEPGRVRLLSDLCAELEACGEVRVRQGMWIGYQTNKEALCTH